MANTILTPTIIAREALMILINNLVSARLFYRDHEKEFSGSKVGDAVTIRKPAVLTANEFTSTISSQNVTETSITLTLEKHFDVSVTVTSKEWTLSLENFSKQIVAPAMAALAEAIDSYALGKYKYVPNVVGTATDPPDSLADLAEVDMALNNLKVPVAGRIAIVNARAKADMMGIDAVARADARGDAGTALREASMGKVMGIDWYMNQNVASHTAGTITTGLIAKAATVVAVGASSFVATTAASTGACALLVGDVISIAGHTQKYALTATATQASAASDVTLTITPPLQTALAGSEAITVQATHVANLAGHPNAIALAIVPLEKPQGAAFAEYIQYEGIGVRVVADYNSSTKSDVISFDVLVGAAVQDWRLMARVLG